MRRSLLCPGKVFHTTGGEAGVLLLLLSPPPPPRPPRGEESLSRHGGDFRTADQSFGWMSAGDPSRILMKLTQKDHRGANQLINWPGVNDSHGNTSSPPPPPVLSSPVHLPPALLAVAHRLSNTGEIPTDASAVGVTQGREGGVKTGHLFTGTPGVVVAYSHRRTETTSQVKVNQRNWTNSVFCACVKTQRRTNFCSSTGRPSSAG